MMNKPVLLFILAVVVLCNSRIVSALGDEVISATDDVVASTTSEEVAGEFDWFDRTAKQMLNGNKLLKQLHEFSQLDPAIQIKYSLSKYLGEKKQIDYNHQAIGRLMLFTLNAIVNSHQDEAVLKDSGVNTEYIRKQLHNSARVFYEKINLETYLKTKGKDLQPQLKRVDSKAEIKRIAPKVNQIIECIVLCSSTVDEFSKFVNKGKLPLFCNQEKEGKIETQMEAAKIIQTQIKKLYEILKEGGKKNNADNTTAFERLLRAKTAPLAVDASGVLSKEALNQLNNANTVCKTISNMYQYFIVREKSKNAKDQIREKVIRQASSLFTQAVGVAVSVASAAVTVSLAGGVQGGGLGGSTIPFVVPAATRMAAFGASNSGALESIVNDIAHQHFEKLGIKRQERISLAEMALTLINGWPFETKSIYDESFGKSKINSAAQETVNQISDQTKEDNEAINSQAKQIFLKIKNLQNRFHRKVDNYVSKSISKKISPVISDHKQAMEALRNETKDLGILSDAGQTDFGEFIIDIVKQVDEETACEKHIGYTLKFFKWMFDDPSKWQKDNEHAFKVADLISTAVSNTPFSDMLDSRGIAYLKGAMELGLNSAEFAQGEMENIQGEFGG